MPERYWLVHPNGGRQLIDPGQFDLDRLAEQARRIGGRLVVEGGLPPPPIVTQPQRSVRAFEPPVSALAPMFRMRLAQIHRCETEYTLDVSPRATVHVLGGYYCRQCLVRVYSHDRVLGRRPLEELFDTFLHEMAHHLEYTEPHTFHARACGRVHGRMHSRLFWKILGELKGRWSDEQHRALSADFPV
jgi:hypothetical protein